jgi:hypothetical protein
MTIASNLYFVQVLQRSDRGDEDTTYLLKGLELICRFRFAFLEPSSDFLGENISLIHPDQLPNFAMKLLKELNLLHRDAQEAGLDRPGMWAKMGDNRSIKGDRRSISSLRSQAERNHFEDHGRQRPDYVASTLGRRNGGGSHSHGEGSPARKRADASRNGGAIKQGCRTAG